ncbi:hypothetical protein GGR52DRAFT_170727 [Hypoxylon sp. FL1284]|nr:hypothetical protein GGR52DRAFT_170727 [Hypoxylon sp. FL1284]
MLSVVHSSLLRLLMCVLHRGRVCLSQCPSPRFIRRSYGVHKTVNRTETHSHFLSDALRGLNMYVPKDSGTPKNIIRHIVIVLRKTRYSSSFNLSRVGKRPSAYRRRLFAVLPAEAPSSPKPAFFQNQGRGLVPWMPSL